MNNYNTGDKLQIDNDTFIIKHIYKTGNGSFYRIKAETGEVLVIPVEGPNLLVHEPTPLEEYEKLGLYYSQTKTIQYLIDPPKGRRTFVEKINKQGLGKIASSTKVTWRHRLDGGVFMVFLDKLAGIVATATADADGKLTTFDWTDIYDY